MNTPCTQSLSCAANCTCRTGGQAAAMPRHDATAAKYADNQAEREHQLKLFKMALHHESWNQFFIGLDIIFVTSMVYCMVLAVVGR